MQTDDFMEFSGPLEAKLSSLDDSELLIKPENIDETKVPGYYKNKFKFKIKSLNSFIDKIKRAEVCRKFLRYNDPDYAGLASIFKDFYEHLRWELEKDPILNQDVSENL